MELKPCPFCGGEIRIVRLHGSYGEPWYARCDRCEVSGYYYKTEDQAIEEWSVRPERTCRNTWDIELTGRLRFKCSECGAVSLEITPRYCPSCGARVVEEVDADGQG